MSKQQSKNYSQTFVAPKDINEFLAQGWEGRIYSRINRRHMNDVCNSAEDLYQEIILSLLQTDYLSRYSPEKGPFESYVYIFVDNYLNRKYARENTRNGKNIVQSYSLETVAPEEDCYEPGKVYLETLFCETNTSSMEFNVAVQELRKRLSHYKANSSTIYKGKEFKRDPNTVLDLLLCDYSVAEIAEIFNTSRQFVYSLIKKIRQVAPDYLLDNYK